MWQLGRITTSASAGRRRVFSIAYTFLREAATQIVRSCSDLRFKDTRVSFTIAAQRFVVCGLG